MFRQTEQPVNGQKVQPPKLLMKYPEAQVAQRVELKQLRQFDIKQ